MEASYEVDDKRAALDDDAVRVQGQYCLTRVVFLRCLGFVYMVAFLVALNDNGALIGEDGLLPATVFMDRLDKHSSLAGLGIFQKLLKMPTLFWFAPPTTDNLWWAAATGAAVSSLVAVRGAANFPAMALLWALYHSLVNVGQTWYSFGWESQLLETGFLAVFLVPWLSLSRFPRGSPPPLVCVWGYRWLMFRIMLGAGLIKLRGDHCWRDLTCMDYHYQTQPVPNPLSPYLHHLPGPDWHKVEVIVNHVVELVLPWGLLLFNRRHRCFSGAIQILFQAVLVTTGNLSFLNWLTALPAIFSFDDAHLAGLFWPRDRIRARLSVAARKAAAGTVAVGGQAVQAAPAHAGLVGGVRGNGLAESESEMESESEAGSEADSEAESDAESDGVAPPGGAASSAGRETEIRVRRRLWSAETERPIQQQQEQEQERRQERRQEQERRRQEHDERQQQRWWSWHAVEFRVRCASYGVLLALAANGNVSVSSAAVAAAAVTASFFLLTRMALRGVDGENRQRGVAGISPPRSAPRRAVDGQRSPQEEPPATASSGGGGGCASWWARVLRVMGVLVRWAANALLVVLVAKGSVPVVKNMAGLGVGQVMNTSFDSLRIVNSYGNFGSVTKTRGEIVLVGTRHEDPSSEAADWKEYQFKCKPGDVNLRPCVISPFHYRLDWQMWFAAFQNYNANPWLVVLVSKLLSPDDSTRALAGSLLYLDPFSDAAPDGTVVIDEGEVVEESSGRERVDGISKDTSAATTGGLGPPPLWIKADLYLYEYTPPSWFLTDAKATVEATKVGKGGASTARTNPPVSAEGGAERGVWWTRRFVRGYLPPVNLGNPSVTQFLLAHGLA